MSDEPEKVDLGTADLAAEKRAALDQICPGVLDDGVLDATRLGELLDAEVTAPSDGAERFGLMWAGKQEAVRSLLTPSRGTLEPELDKSIDFDAAENVFVEGDNLEVLKLLQKAYNDRVKLIYIDPPYNTGSDDFIYQDNFADTTEGYLSYRDQLDKDGNRLSADAEVVGRRHSRWLSMMYPRLILARNLLTQDGLIAVSIDDHEVFHLRCILDEVFGPENFLNAFTWVSNLKGRQISGSGAAGTKEYVLVYARDAEQVGAFRADVDLLKQISPGAYKNVDYEVLSDDYGPYVLKNELHNTNSAFNETSRPNLVFDIYYRPETEEVRTEPLSGGHIHDGFVKIAPKANNNGVNQFHAFRWSRQKVETESHNLAFVSRPEGYKVFTKVRDVGVTAVKDLILGVSTNEGSRDLETLGMSASDFDYPKPARLIQLFVACATTRDSVVMDLFAGSGATAHAVALQNASDDGRRRVVLVNLPERKSKADGAGLVSDVGRARMGALTRAFPRAAEQGVRSFRLRKSNFVRASNGSPHAQLTLAESTLAGSGASLALDGIAAEVLAAEGVPLDEVWTRHLVNDELVVEAAGVAVALSRAITETLVAEVMASKPRVAVFLEDGFAGRDSVKANAVTNAKNLGVTLKTV